MKAGLVTFYHIHHYGALFQAAATERAVEHFGWDCEIVDYFVNQDNALFKRPQTALLLLTVGSVDYCVLRPQ